MDDTPVFYDALGKRRIRVFGTVFVLLAIVMAVLAAMLFLNYALQDKKAQSLVDSSHKERPVLISQAKEPAGNNGVTANMTAPAPVSDASVKATGDRIVAGIYSPHQKSGISSFRRSAKNLTHVMPEWLRLNRGEHIIDFSAFDKKKFPDNEELINLARDNRVHIMPVITNEADGRFEPELVLTILASKQKKSEFINELRGWLAEQKFQGICFDFRGLSAEDYAELAKLQKTMKKEFKRYGFKICTVLDVAGKDTPVKKLNSVNDIIMLSTFDYAHAKGAPGPITPLGRYGSDISGFAGGVSRDKLAIVLDNFGYDWTEGVNPAKKMTFLDVMTIAKQGLSLEEKKDIIEFEQTSRNPTFSYLDQGRKKHEIWFLDAVTAYNQMLAAREYCPKGVVLRELGCEDPSVWSVIDRNKAASVADIKSLNSIEFDNKPLIEGKGSFLTLRSERSSGKRNITRESETGFFLDETYLKIPSPSVVEQAGYKPKTIALTFDGGPDNEFTPQLLDVLEQHKIHATFFVAGEKAKMHPELLERIQAGGHEIGNNTYSQLYIANISDKQLESEVVKTQRAIKKEIGITTRIFRGSYGHNSDNISEEIAHYVGVVNKLGYLWVGYSIDPMDWGAGNTKSTKEDTTKKIADAIKKQAYGSRGNMLVFNYGSTKRKEFIEALQDVVPELQNKGYSFTTASRLIDKDKEALMVPLGLKERLVLSQTNLMNSITGFGNKLVIYLLIVVLVFSVIRLSLILLLSSRVRYRELTHAKNNKKARKPSVSVIIPAYNEEKTIEATIHSVLSSRYKRIELIVVDDGSTDDTMAVAVRTIESYGDVNAFVLSQRNAGKAVALNRAIGEASGEILVCLDADTIMLPNAIGHLVKHFNNPKVGGVAGNVKVGNRCNLLTRWQSIEYITSQSVDRRAMYAIAAITVIPGAIGAWRKKAVLEAGGYSSDTLAEDMELTLRLQKNGWEIRTEQKAISLTEAPSSVAALFKQRFRWSYGSLQCLWKYRDMLFSNGYLGWIILPLLWVFQVLLQSSVFPLLDLYALYLFVSLVTYVFTTYSGFDSEILDFYHIDPVFAVSFLSLTLAIELIPAFVAYRFDKERLHSLWLVPWQRLAYRQILYMASIKSLWTAISGSHQRWGKLERLGSVQVDTDFRVALNNTIAPEPAGVLVKHPTSMKPSNTKPSVNYKTMKKSTS